jgi:PBSX family phage terminase large subunit
MIFDPNPLFYEMVNIYANNRDKPDKITICNEGSSRSSKTWDFFHFLVMYCENNQNEHNEIYILRETLTDCKDFTFKEFQKCLKKIDIWDDECYKNPQKPYYNLYGNDIYFRGLDDSSEGYPSDISFVNEGLENQNKEKVDGIAMRCRKLMVYDWNPKYTQHWCFNLEGQPNVHFTHSTYKNNKHLEQSVINTIEAYCPWNFEDLHLPEKQRRPHLINIKNGTADKYRWQVYGEGIRSAPEGLIFQHVTWIDEFPDMGFSYGLDFGFTTDPTSLVKYAETSNNIFIELLLYEPTENAELIHDFALTNGINIRIPVTADSSDKYTSEKKGTVEMVVDLRKKGWNISKVSKTKSIMYWLGSMKKKKIHIIKNHLYSHARKEQENYVMKVINGIAINQPVDKWNHMWDSARYAHIAYSKPTFTAKKR